VITSATGENARGPRVRLRTTKPLSGDYRASARRTAGTPRAFGASASALVYEINKRRINTVHHTASMAVPSQSETVHGIGTPPDRDAD
jgi:hypothetical protein